MDGGNGLFMPNGLRGLLEGNNYHASDRFFSVVAAFINRSTRQERTVALTKVHTSCSKSVYSMTGVKGHRAWKEKTLELPDEGAGASILMIVETFDEHCKTSLYTLMSHLIDHIVEDLR